MSSNLRKTNRADDFYEEMYLFTDENAIAF